MERELTQTANKIFQDRTKQPRNEKEGQVVLLITGEYKQKPAYKTGQRHCAGIHKTSLKQHNTAPHNTTQHNTTQQNTAKQNKTKQNKTKHNTTQHNTTQDV